MLIIPFFQLGVMNKQKQTNSASLVALKMSASAWFAVAALGQWIFMSYVIAVYGGAAAQGDLAAWNKHLSGAYVPGEFTGNIAAALHLGLAIIILGGGPLQLIPQVRNRFPTFHRWTGRTYMVAVVTTAIAGLYMLFPRDIGGLSTKIGFVLQTAFILLFSAIALRHAMRREIDVHMRWATRLFLAASSVWSFRVILMIWVATAGEVGVDFSTGKGWFIDFMSIAGQYLPLAAYEFYWRIRDRGGVISRVIMTVFLGIAALATAGGVFLATIGMWFPSG